MSCHNDQKQKGKVRLDDISFQVDTVEKADLWQRVLNSINSGEMPPAEERQPEPGAKADFLDDLSRMLVTARAVLSDSGGKITMRRLNRREYKNTIRDLLGVDLRVNELPPDGGAGAFDTVGSSLFMSSTQFEQYLALGRQALDEHFARFVIPVSGKPRLLHIEAEEKNVRIANALAQRVDARQRYENWTAAVEAAARESRNEHIAAAIRAEKPSAVTHLYTQWRRIPGAPDPGDFGFADPVAALHHGHADWNHYVPHHRKYVDHPLTKTGAFLTIEDMAVNPYQAFRIPGDWPAGEYIVRVRIAATGNTPVDRHFVEFGSQHDSGVRAVVSSHQVTGTMDKPQILEIPLKFSPANGRGFFLQERGSYASEGAAREVFNEAKERNGVGPEFALWIDWIEVAGAGDPGGPAVGANVRKLRKDPEQWANKYMPVYAQGYAEKFSRFQKWCAAVDEAADTAENAGIAERLRGDPKVKQSPHLFYNRFADIPGAPSPARFGFRDIDDAQFARSEYQYHFRYYDDYVKLPARETGSWLMLYSLGRFTGISAPQDWPAGKYTLRVRLAASEESPSERRFIEIGTGKADAADFNVLSSHQVTGTLAQPQMLEIPVEINANGDRNFAIRDKRPNTRAAEYAMFREAWDKTGTGPRPCIWVDFVELEAIGATPPVMAAGAGIAAHRVRVEPELWANQQIPLIIRKYEEPHERYLQWTVAVDDAAKRPENAETTRKWREHPREKGDPALFYNHWEEIEGAPSPGKFGFTDAADAQFARSLFRLHHQYHIDYLELPQRDTGAYLMLKSALSQYTVSADGKWPAGRYVLRVRLAATEESPAGRRFVEVVQGPWNEHAVLSSHQVTGTLQNPQVLDIPIELTPTGRREFILRDKRPNDRGAESELFYASLKKHGTGPRPCIWIDWMEIAGPLEAHAGASLPPALAAGETDARKALESFAERAFRGKKPAPGFLDKLVFLHETRRRAGDSFDKAIREPMSVILASPGFLYLQETGVRHVPPDTPLHGEAAGVDRERGGKEKFLSVPELAARLSYFLWSAPPDQTLLEADLASSEVLSLEMERMIASPKADEFVSGFVNQWLGMDRLDFFQFDSKQFRDFDESTKAAARREVYETFAHLLRNRGSLTKLLKSDEVHVNGLLANYYGIEGVRGDAFQRVKLPEDSPRGGLLGMAAILAMGSNGERTSPVERGAWVLRKLLHNPPPPAPPNVPQLTRLENRVLTTRERLLAHQEEPQCLQCHRKIDSIGLGLENFNAAGKWRTEETYEKRGAGRKTWSIDAAGQFHNGPTFRNYFELRELIAEKREAFARGFTEALIEYALGRPYGFTDAALADEMMEKAGAANFEVKAFLAALVGSRTFGRK